MSKELKACPLCEAAVAHKYNSTTSADIKCKRSVKCIQCGCGFIFFGTKDEIADAWNTRPSPWIPVGEGKIKQGKEYLVMKRHGGMCKASLSPSGNWMNAYGLVITSPVTDYMPIPPLPERK